ALSSVNGGEGVLFFVLYPGFRGEKQNGSPLTLGYYQVTPMGFGGIFDLRFWIWDCEGGRSLSLVTSSPTGRRQRVSRFNVWNFRFHNAVGVYGRWQMAVGLLTLPSPPCPEERASFFVLEPRVSRREQKRIASHPGLLSGHPYGVQECGVQISQGRSLSLLTSAATICLGGGGDEGGGGVGGHVVEVDFFDEADAELVIDEIDLFGRVDARMPVLSHPPEVKCAENRDGFVV